MVHISILSLTISNYIHLFLPLENPYHLVILFWATKNIPLESITIGGVCHLIPVGFTIDGDHIPIQWTREAALSEQCSALTSVDDWVYGVSIFMGVQIYSWMVLMENPINMDDLGVPPFQETSIWDYATRYIGLRIFAIHELGNPFKNQSQYYRMTFWVRCHTVNTLYQVFSYHNRFFLRTKNMFFIVIH